MRANGVVVDAPSFDDVARLGERGEHMLVQALVPQLAVEALHEAVLLRLARRDVVKARDLIRSRAATYQRDSRGYRA